MSDLTIGKPSDSANRSGMKLTMMTVCAAELEVGQELCDRAREGQLMRRI